jgi:hypothetical protein
MNTQPKGEILGFLSRRTRAGLSGEFTVGKTGIEDLQIFEWSHLISFGVQSGAQWRTLCRDAFHRNSSNVSKRNIRAIARDESFKREWAAQRRV